jgi:hypothetical protein
MESPCFSGSNPDVGRLYMLILNNYGISYSQPIVITNQHRAYSFEPVQYPYMSMDYIGADRSLSLKPFLI